MSKKTENAKDGGLSISAKSFITAIIVIFVLMILTYGLTFLIPGGGIPFWKWALSPILVLGAEGNGSLIGVIVFLLVIGGVFNCLDKCGLMKYMLDMITNRFGKERYKLLAIVTLFFMGMGSFIGSFEEAVPLVPIVVALAIRLGWDALVGLGMSLLAIGCGFAAGVCNPFTVGVAQELAGLPMFSGMWFRAIGFVVVYAWLFLFLFLYAKKIEQPLSDELVNQTFTKDKQMSCALKYFLGFMGIGIFVVLSSVVLTFLQDYTMIIVALTFLVAGIIATKSSGRGGNIWKTFLNGVMSVLPGVIMILMANSIKYTLEEGNILNTILQGMLEIAKTLPGWSIILFIYLIVLVMNFFISSGSAKAFLLMPLIVPLAEPFGISAQLCVMAFAFGDGFSNVFYPTNPVLLIGIGLAGVDYGKWAKWSWKFQIVNIVLSSALLLVGMAIGY
ncbi:MAG: YfcC family protein [Lachnospiraceae bacterium]|nr:YfcC family protein [Lachnospiraceae bacterium]